MADYLFYTYFEEGREYFVYKDLTFERSHKKEKDFPFLESLLRFTYLDIWPMENLFKKMDKALLNFCRERDADSRGIVMSTLEELAKRRAQEIVSNFSHDGCPGYAGENIFREGIASTSVARPHEWWMNSPGHRTNILLPEYTRIGISCYTFDGHNWWVENFMY